MSRQQVATAKFSFFKETTRDSDSSTYIASEHVDGIKFIEKRNGLNKLKPSDTAKWAVASTFIYDLHSKNVGYTDEGIVALDLDGHNRPLTNDFFTNIITAAHSINIHCPWLSLDDIREMKKIYSEMQSKPLPEHHDSFHLTDEMYQNMLNAYINICDKVIASHVTIIPELEHSRRDNKINQLWCKTAKDYISTRPQYKNKLYNELCGEKKPKHSELPDKPKTVKYVFKKRPKRNELHGKSKPNDRKFPVKNNRKDTEKLNSSFSP